MCVCVCVCVWVCLCGCVCVCVGVCMHMCRMKLDCTEIVCIYNCMYLCLYAESSLTVQKQLYVFMLYTDKQAYATTTKLQ